MVVNILKKDSLGERMKGYEGVSNIRLTCRTPVILRLDGRSFHSFCKGFQKPFDEILMSTMQQTMVELCRSIQGCVFGYTQSDEISLILVDYEKLESSAWFDDKVQKMCSVAASMTSRYFNRLFIENVQLAMQNEQYKDMDFSKYTKKFFSADFDCRVFNVPKEDVCNCIIWRQKDAERNSIQMLAQSLYSHKELQGISCNDLQNKMFTEKGINWNELKTYCKRGSACRRDNEGQWKLDLDMPILQGDRWYIEDCIYFEED